MGGRVAMALCNDIGTVGTLRKGGLQLAASGIDKINQMFPLANEQAQLQIAPGTNFKLRDSAGIEFIVNFPIVQAPFRIYYAYNPLRIHQTLYAPNAPINGVNLSRQCIASGQTNPITPIDPNNLNRLQSIFCPAVVQAVQPLVAPA